MIARNPPACRRFSSAVGGVLAATLALVTLCGCTSTPSNSGATTTSTPANPGMQTPADTSQQGTIERVDYRTTHDGAAIDKHALVYLPAGYSERDRQRYDVLYLMHGAGMTADTWFGGPGEDRPLKNLLDNIIASGTAKPMIVVTPTFYPDDDATMDLHVAGELDRAFHTELDADLMPAVEGRYRTFVDSVDDAGFSASRDHRAFGGFSMGAVTTWYTFINELDWFRYYLPMAGDSWVIRDTGGMIEPQRTAQYLADVASDSSMDGDDYRILASVGSADGTIGQMQPQIDAMRAFPDRFDDDALRFTVDPEGGHDEESFQNQITTSLPFLFR